MADFIDRAKLEDAADQWLIEDENWGDRHHESFMAGVDAVLSSLALDPEAREEQGQVEWGVAYRQNDGKLFVDEAVDYDDAVFRVANSSVYDMVVQRRVTAYIPVGEAPAPEARSVE